MIGDHVPDALALQLHDGATIYQPLGATGLAHARSWCGPFADRPARQVDRAKIAPQHNLGLGGACVVTMYRRD